VSSKFVTLSTFAYTRNIVIKAGFMKLFYFLVILSLLPEPTAQAEIYKRVDADGHVTYSSNPLKGGKKLHLTPLPTVPPQAQSKDNGADFPRVDTATQKGRDNTRRQILQDELASEEKALAAARNNLQAGAENPEIYTDKEGKVYRNVSKQEEKMSLLQEQVQMHEKNIAALNTELSKNNK
jgi:hypothetical protein